MDKEASQSISDAETECIIGPSPPEFAVSGSGTPALESSQASVSTQAADCEQFFGFRVVPKRKSCSQDSNLERSAMESDIIKTEESVKKNLVIEAIREREKKVNKMLQQVLDNVQIQDQSFQDFVNLTHSNDDSNSTRDDSGEDFVSTEASQQKLEQTLKALKERVDYFLLVQQETALYLQQASVKFKKLDQQYNAMVTESENRISERMREYTKMVTEASQKLAEIEEKLPKVHVKSYIVYDRGGNDYNTKFCVPKISGSGQIEPDDFSPCMRKKKIVKTKDNSQCSSSSSQRSQNLSQSQLAAIKLRAKETFLFGN